MAMGKSFSILALVCALMMGFGGMASAADVDDDDFYGPQLSREQMEQARKIFNDNYKSMEATRKALAAKRAELDAQLASPTPDKAKIEALSREIGDLRGKMLAARVEVRSELEKQGLPTDFYGPRREGRGDYRRGPDYGPRGWHRGYGHGHGHYGRGMMGCGGCW